MKTTILLILLSKYSPQGENIVVVFFYDQWFEMRGDCSFCWYRWNCWPSLFKLSFNNCTRVREIWKTKVVVYIHGLGLWCLTSLSTISQLYRGGKYYWWRKPEYPNKTTTLSYNVVSSTSRHEQGFEL
jgi:hypothetical protein